MYQVIAILKADQGKYVRPYWVIKTYKTHNAAQKRMIKMRQQNNSKYDFNLNIL